MRLLVYVAILFVCLATIPTSASEKYNREVKERNGKEVKQKSTKYHSDEDSTETKRNKRIEDIRKSIKNKLKTDDADNTEQKIKKFKKNDSGEIASNKYGKKNKNASDEQQDNKKNKKRRNEDTSEEIKPRAKRSVKKDEPEERIKGRNKEIDGNCYKGKAKNKYGKGAKCDDISDENDTGEDNTDEDVTDENTNEDDTNEDNTNEDDTDENDSNENDTNEDDSNDKDTNEDTNEDESDDEESEEVPKKKARIYIKKFAHEKQKKVQDTELGSILKIHKKAGVDKREIVKGGQKKFGRNDEDSSEEDSGFPKRRHFVEEDEE